MLDTSLTEFTRLLQQRGLIEKANTFCNSWRDGFVAQDADGHVFIYNDLIRFAHEGWTHRKESHCHSTRLLCKLAAPAQWHTQIIPVRCLLEEQPEANAAQLSFLQTLSTANAVGTIKSFLSSWQHDSWIAMDSGGMVYLYNRRPGRAGARWTAYDQELNHYFDLGYFDHPQLDWEKCLVKLTWFKEPIQLANSVDLNNIQRMDCWL